MNFFILSLLIGFILIVGGSIWLDRWLRKKLHIPKKDGWVYKPVHPIQGWIEGLIIVSGLIFTFNREYYGVDSQAFFPLVFFILFTFRAFMEWKFERERREYVLTLISLFPFILWIGFVFFYY
ncbi:DUF4181 domain-containing protein [Rossellomorea aquimaris]|uniref:DUF4181 domain-containing protein n=1 Tax=Rossellomorea aquimaris TaxID=189382 RepID=UPI001CD2D3B3|nr:DUF4181 domain-containing protein [Rossellomorea aquimaris]MCA1055891.1 DUF4181 domain-containing protein [Rossellomorea aquimaris]